jgi:hypothetical protein
MSDLLLLISEYGWYLIIGIAGLLSIGMFAILNAEDFPFPDECFDCSEITCRKCHRREQEVGTQWVCTPDLAHAPMLDESDCARQQGALLPSK